MKKSIYFKKSFINIINSKLFQLKFLILFLSIWSLFLFFNYWNIFSGDSEIHIIYARNFLNGHFLQFNPGYYSGGESSPLFMLIIAILYKLLGSYLPYGMKTISFLSFIWILVLIYEINPSKIKIIKLLGSLLFSSLCFIPFQAMQGMENFLFAAVVVTVVFLEINKFKLSSLFTFLLIILSYLLRPEGILLGLYFLNSSIINQRKKRIMITIIALLFCFAFYKLLILLTGSDIYNAGLIRSYTSRLRAIPIDFESYRVFISRKTFIALIYSFPLLILFIFNYKYLDKNALNSIIVFVLFPIILHVFLFFPDSHISRYLLYSYGVIFLLSAKYSLPKLSNFSIILLTIFLITISYNEYQARKALPFLPVQNSIETTMSRSYMKAFSDELFNNFSFDSNKIRIGITEVQIRGKLDDRFDVWSLDGITDNKITKYVNENSIDHFGYIKDRSINLLLALPNYNLDKSIYSLKSIANELKDDSEENFICREGIKFSKSDFKSKYTNIPFYIVSDCKINRFK